MRPVVLLDGYIDEPSCLGVPPYIAPYVRYIYGGLLDAGCSEKNIRYVTIDQVRQDGKWGRRQRRAWVIIVCGTTVPGHYMGGKPLSLKELKRLLADLRLADAVVWLAGPVIEAGIKLDGVDHYCSELAVQDVHEALAGNTPRQGGLMKVLGWWAALGASLITRHPNYPNVVCELETYRGCPRESNCAFCSEAFKKLHYTRTPAQIVEEAGALYRYGARFFRLGCQTDLIMYAAEDRRPNPEPIRRVYEGIRDVAPGLKVLHLDNINPSSLALFPDEGQEILHTIVENNTAGDIASFGLESADPAVLTVNNVGTTPELTLRAIEMVNEVGGRRENGIPKLLPGLNFLHGLKGETGATYVKNLEYLRMIRDAGLLVRRINVRQVRPIRGYGAQKVPRGRFEQYKQTINDEINRPMLQRIFPLRLLMHDVFTEVKQGKTVYGRQMGTYPIRTGIPGEHPLGEFISVRVCDHGYRSITGLRYPFKINEASITELEYLPGVGEKRARRLFLHLPVKTEEDLYSIIDDPGVVDEILPFIDSFSSPDC